MGQRLTPSLAIAFMSKIEAPVLDLRLQLYWRYIDDCFVIYSTQEEMDKCFDLSNQQSEYIKSTREKLRDNWLPFLNVQINLNQGGYITKWYRKPSNKNILVYYLSSHPSHTKRALLRNMFQTFKERVHWKKGEGGIDHFGAKYSHSKWLRIINFQ